MANNEQRRQKKLAKLKAKRAEKRATLAKQSQPNHRLLLKQVETCPVYEALVPLGLWERGIGQLIISRTLPDGRIAFACILLDVFCLGAKSSFFRVEYPATYKRMVLEMGEQDPLAKVAPEKFAKIVLGAVSFAAAIGLKPDADFAECRHVLANIDTSACTEEFTYGQNGKPHYISGPRDSLSRSKEIAQLVTAAGGHYTILAGGPDGPGGIIDMDDGLSGIDLEEDDTNAIEIR